MSGCCARFRAAMAAKAAWEERVQREDKVALDQ
jgi:hypothetical protein